LRAGLGILKTAAQNVAAEIEHWINVFQVDSHNHYIHLLLEKVSKVMIAV